MYTYLHLYIYIYIDICIYMHIDHVCVYHMFISAMTSSTIYVELLVTQRCSTCSSPKAILNIALNDEQVRHKGSQKMVNLFVTHYKRHDMCAEPWRRFCDTREVSLCTILCNRSPLPQAV